LKSNSSQYRDDGDQRRPQQSWMLLSEGPVIWPLLECRILTLGSGRHSHRI
jgi:hypothetical protein